MSLFITLLLVSIKLNISLFNNWLHYLFSISKENFYMFVYTYILNVSNFSLRLSILIARLKISLEITKSD